jgi:hypothetical protein
VTGRARPAPDRLLPLDRLVGRPVVDRDGQPAGHIQELRVEMRDGEWIVVEYVLGIGGLLERLNVGLRLLLGGRIRRRSASADRIDFSDPETPRLTCRRDDLRQLS